MLRHLPDGSSLSVIGSVKVRVITAAVTVTCHDGITYGGTYRLATTLLDHRAYPAGALMTLYHERWEHEITYLALRHTLLRSRVLNLRLAFQATSKRQTTHPAAYLLNVHDMLAPGNWISHIMAIMRRAGGMGGSGQR